MRLFEVLSRQIAGGRRWAAVVLSITLATVVQARADDSCGLLSCLSGSCFDSQSDCESKDKKEEEPKLNYGPCDCQPRKTLLQWSYGTSFSGGPPSMDEPLESD